MVFVGFLTATSLIQLIVAILFFPMFIYFAVRVFPRRTRAVRIPVTPAISVRNQEDLVLEEVNEETIKLKKEGVDVDRRIFLKLIGTAGLSLFFFSLFTKKAQAAFFGSVPGPGTVALKDSLGNEIDPAEKQPTDGYNITELDDSTPSYYGFMNKEGAWFIMKEDPAHPVDVPYYSYVKGDSSFSTNWTSRATLSYDYFNNTF